MSRVTETVTINREIEFKLFCDEEKKKTETNKYESKVLFIELV